RNVPLQEDTSRMDLAANAIKSVSTDYMQSASQHLLQLVGAKGYRLDHIAGRSTVDSRPFQIFEGSNDILYQQISESVLKMMRGAKEANLFTFVSGHPLMSSVADRFKDVLDIEIDLKMAQRKLVDLGRAIGRMITMNMTLELGHSGFNLEMIQNSLAVAEKEIREILSAFSYEPSIVPMVDPDMPTSEGWRQYL
ncbi:MAG: acyl-CoA dehydrogenase family protein, partial [Rhodothermales bacterium]